MRWLPKALIFLWCLAFSLPATATIITTYQLEGVMFNDGGTATGTFNVNFRPSTLGPYTTFVDIVTTESPVFSGAHYQFQGILNGFGMGGTRLYLDPSALWGGTVFQFFSPMSPPFHESVLVLNLSGLSPYDSSILVGTRSYPGEGVVSISGSGIVDSWRVLISGMAVPISSSGSNPPPPPPLPPPLTSVPEPPTIFIVMAALCFGLKRRKSPP